MVLRVFIVRFLAVLAIWLCSFCKYSSASIIFDSAFTIKVFDNNPDPIVFTDTPSFILPFTRVGNLILVKAKVDSVEGNFILDTGAPYLILNETYFRDYPTETNNDVESSGANGPIANVSKIRVDKLTFGTFQFSQVHADLVSLSKIENSKNIKILGLIGMQFLKKCELIIDYENSLLYLHLINRKETDTYQSVFLQDKSTFNTLPIELVNDKILTTTEVAGKKIKVMVDCGAEMSMLDSRLPDKVLDDILIKGRIIVNGNGSKKVEALQGEIMNMNVGGNIWQNVPVIVTNMEKSCLSYESCVKGILGFDFLSVKKVGFNFVQYKMYIWK